MPSQTKEISASYCTDLSVLLIDMFNIVKFLFCFVFDNVKVVLLKLEVFEFRVVSHSCTSRSSCLLLVWIFPHVELRCYKDM
jgi:hypothetical protein